MQPTSTAALGQVLPLWSAIPFVGLLLSLALFPLAVPHFWHRHYRWIATTWALAFAVPFLLAHRDTALHAILHVCLADYLPFVILLWGLFTVAGGIVLEGTLPGTPRVNTALLALGTFIASWVGTTGASMLMIRPVLRANAGRKRKTHVVVFFIFLVSNVGGSLTPLGDPPLFLGFLRGVPFFWTLHLLPHTVFVAGMLLGGFYVLDRRYSQREPGTIPPDGRLPRVRIRGAGNLLLLGGILAAVLLSGTWDPGTTVLFGVSMPLQNLVRDVLILALGGLSLVLTPRALRRANEFSWEPMQEVAWLFAGIFVTILPALEILRAGESGALAPLVAAIREPWQYFWVTGLLSSFLDNAPTYLAFFHALLGGFYPGMSEEGAVANLVAHQAPYLEAIAAGSVFMGANSYIGNAPNFMVRSIAEKAGVAMPSFFGFMLRWSVPILFPLFLIVGWLFL